MMDKVKVPHSLSERQITLAKAYAQDKFDTNINVIDFCSKYKVGSATWSKWQKDEVFESYLVACSGSLVPEDKWEIYNKVKKGIEKLATSNGAGIKEYELYLKTFDFMVKADNQKQMQDLGISPSHERIEVISIEERKRNLLSRLQN